MPKCPIHHIDLVCFCPACRGSVRSKRKTIAARQNAKLAGRPKKSRARRIRSASKKS